MRPNPYMNYDEKRPNIKKIFEGKFGDFSTLSTIWLKRFITNFIIATIRFRVALLTFSDGVNISLVVYRAKPLTNSFLSA